ncbi:MAG: hypothetical protein ACI9IP_002159 [Arcticibacterium sp.]|jgi:hypothetical protein
MSKSLKKKYKKPELKKLGDVKSITLKTGSVSDFGSNQLTPLVLHHSHFSHLIISHCLHYFCGRIHYERPLRNNRFIQCFSRA